MMVIAVGLSSYNIALFHLVNHAFYKALLFLGAGAVIHAVADNQDFRKYGGLKPFLPLTYSVMLIASLSLVAFPFMTGFYSKDFILESAYGQFNFGGTVVYFIATIGAMFTTLYSVKVLYLTFLTNPNGPLVNYSHLSDRIVSPTVNKRSASFIAYEKWVLSNWVSIMKKDNSKWAPYNYTAIIEKYYDNEEDIPFERYNPFFWDYPDSGREEYSNLSNAIDQYMLNTFPSYSDKRAHEGDIFMSLPLIILAVFSIFFGYITKDIFIGLGSGFFADNSLFIHPIHEIMLDTEFAVPTFFKLLPLIFTISLSTLAIVISEFIPKVLISFKFSRLGYNIFGFFNQRFLIELFYNKYITGLILKLGGQTTKVIDKGSVELLGPYGLEKGLITLSRSIASLDTGVITSYALYILIGFIFYMFIPYLAIFDNSLLILILLSLFTILKSKGLLEDKSNDTSKSKGLLEDKPNDTSKSKGLLEDKPVSFVLVDSPHNNGINSNKNSIFSVTTNMLVILKKLEDKVLNLYKIKKVNSINLLEDGNVLNPYALFIDKYGKKHNKKEILSLYPALKKISDDIFLGHKFSLENRTNKTVYDPTLNKTYYIKELTDFLLKHNLVHGKLPIKAMYKEKEKFLAWVGYNTPSPSVFKVTALTGTKLEASSNNDVISYYYNWMVSSFLLGLEANQLFFALKYSVKKSSNSSVSTLEENCFIYWQSRQIDNILAPMLASPNKDEIYLIDFTLDHTMLREIMEDYTYVLLNLILANTIINYMDKLDLYSLNSDEFFKEIKLIIDNHYLSYSKGYDLLYELRMFSANNFLTEKMLNNLP